MAVKPYVPEREQENGQQRRDQEQPEVRDLETKCSRMNEESSMKTQVRKAKIETAEDERAS